MSELAQSLETIEDGIQRRGLVLAFLMRFKQICNHPSQWLGDGNFTLCRQREVPTAGRVRRGDRFAAGKGACLHPVSRDDRTACRTICTKSSADRGWCCTAVHRGQEAPEIGRSLPGDDGPPFFVLSLKAGGTGLNLTAACHVIHFDRWWNPAVENQATDRAFRIGQKRNVLVHKFVCRGTIEERIDSLITEKRALADSLLDSDGGAEKQLTEMSNTELLNFVALDLNTAGSEAGE